MSRPTCTLTALIALAIHAPLAQADLPATMNDTDADASFVGEAAGDFGGRCVAGNADVNGDGYPDLLIGAYGSDDGAAGGGETYLLLGGATRFSGGSLLSAADASWVGTTAGEYTSLELALASDLDGDGYDDILTAAYKNSETAYEAGKLYVVYGDPAAAWGLDVGLDNADAAFLGEAYEDHAGRAVAGLGDVNGDGYGDLLVGGCWNSSAASKAGKAYLLLGGGTRWTGEASIATADASFTGQSASDYAGRCVAGLGDVDGDGLQDMAVGAYCFDHVDASGVALSNAGRTYVLMGRGSGWAPDQPLEGFADASFTGEGDSHYAGLVVAPAGDVDADGYRDMLVCAYKASLSASQAGAVYLVRGDASRWSGDASLSLADAVYTGEDALDWAGRSASGVGDVDADGFDDFMVGATGADDGASSGGRAYLILGSSAPTSASLSDADTIIDGTTASAEQPYVLTWVGDLDGGGHADLLLPAYNTTVSAGYEGRAYLFYTDDHYDQDGDGYDVSDGDCDDGDASIHPGAAEIAYDGIDQDCDGDDLTDVDGDGYDAVAAGGDDCDDGAPAVNPGARELCFNGLDDDCDGVTDHRDEDGDGENDCDGICPDTGMIRDQDGDGVVREECGGEDCDDEDPEVYPNALEVPYDGVDQDCDGDDLTDVDLDGFDAAEAGGEDCDDGDAEVHPGAEEIPYNGVDDDCTDGDLRDVDGDGHDAEAVGGDDCADEDPAIHGDAEEICDNGIDDDCDDVADADDPDCGATDDTGGDCQDPEDSGQPATDDTGTKPEQKNEGCAGCASGGGTLGLSWLLGLIGLLARRRARA